MKFFSPLLRRFLRQTHGQDIIEYALLAGIVTAATVLAIGQVSTKVVNVYGNNVTQIIASGDGAPVSGPGGNGNGGNGNSNGNGGNGNSNGNGNTGGNGNGN